MHKSKPKLAVMLSRFPLPLDKGDKLRAFEQIKQFSAHFDVQIFCLTDKTPAQKDVQTVKQLGIEVSVYLLPRWISLLSLVRCLFSSIPFQVAYFYHPFLAKKIEKDISAFQPDHIFCQLIRAAEYVKNIHHIPKTLDYMDAFSKGMERRTKQANFFTKWLFNSEHSRLLAYERSIFDYFENRCMISEMDLKFINHPQKLQILKIPNGVREDFFEEVEADKKYDAVFIGNLSYPPNVQAVRYMVERILPLLHQSQPNFTFAAFGAAPHPSLQKLQGRNGFTLHGWTEDIRKAYASGKMFVAPMFIGTGLQNKLLEAMALSVPCLTTTLSNDPIGTIPETHVLLAENEEEFVSQIIRLQDEVLSKSLASSARQFIWENYRWESATMPIIEQMLKDKNLQSPLY